MRAEIDAMYGNAVGLKQTRRKKREGGHIEDMLTNLP